jgi:KTSC domain
MRRIPVRSTTLRSVGYDKASRVLEAEFRTGRVYQYRGVTPNLYLSFLAARSKGTFFNKVIRDSFPYIEV